MSELTARHLVANGVTGVIISNRSFDRATALAAQFNGRAVKFSELYRYMEEADIVISCTAANHCVVRAEEMSLVMEKRGGRKIFMIDIAVPRDIEAEVGQIEGVSLFDIDDLNVVVDKNLAERRKAAARAEEIIEEELEEFMKWLGTQFIVPTISALKKWGEEIKQKELKRALNRLGELSEHDRKVIYSLANSIVNQILHLPVIQLKRYALTTEGHLYTEILQNLFNLDVPGQKPKSGSFLNIRKSPDAKRGSYITTNAYLEAEMKREIVVGTRKANLPCGRPGGWWTGLRSPVLNTIIEYMEFAPSETTSWMWPWRKLAARASLPRNWKWPFLVMKSI